MTVKEIKNALMTIEKVQFTLPGYGEFEFTACCPDDDGVNGVIVRLHSQMNVKKFGPTCVTLYTFDMMNNKTVAKIKYTDVTILE